jgi:hypothetical protein
MTPDRSLQMSPDELDYHKDLQRQIADAGNRETQAKAVWLQAQLDLSGITSSQQAFLNHLGKKYGLLPNDVIDGEGRFHYLDPQWAMLAAQEAQAQAVAAEAQAAMEAPPAEIPPPVNNQGIEDMVPLDGEDLGKTVIPDAATKPKAAAKRRTPTMV